MLISVGSVEERSLTLFQCLFIAIKTFCVLHVAS